MKKVIFFFSAIVLLSVASLAFAESDRFFIPGQRGDSNAPRQEFPWPGDCPVGQVFVCKCRCVGNGCQGNVRLNYVSPKECKSSGEQLSKQNQAPCDCSTSQCGCI